MESDPASMAEHKHTNRWMTMLALGLLAICLLACLYILIGFPAEAQTVGGSTIDPATTQVPASPTPYQPRRQPLASYAAPAAATATVQPPAALHTDSTADEIHAEIEGRDVDQTGLRVIGHRLPVYGRSREDRVDATPSNVARVTLDRTGLIRIGPKDCVDHGRDVGRVHLERRVRLHRPFPLFLRG